MKKRGSWRSACSDHLLLQWLLTQLQLLRFALSKLVSSLGIGSLDLTRLYNIRETARCSGRDADMHADPPPSFQPSIGVFQTDAQQESCNQVEWLGSGAGVCVFEGSEQTGVFVALARSAEVHVKIHHLLEDPQISLQCESCI